MDALNWASIVLTHNQMKVEIIKDEHGNPIGWSMEGENREEINKLIDIRNLQFFGHNDTAIRYNGRTGGSYEDYNPGKLSWVQQQYCSDYQPKDKL